MDKRLDGQKSKITVKHHTDPPSWRFQRYKFRGKSGTASPGAVRQKNARAPEAVKRTWTYLHAGKGWFMVQVKCRRRADVSNFLCCTRKRDLFPFPRGTKEIGNAYTQAKPTREINDTRGVRHSKVPITFRARKAVLCLILKMIRWKYKSTKQNWLTGLWARRCANIQQVLISKFASGPENFPRLCSRIVSVLT